MTRTTSSAERAHVVIVGGGFAAVETMLALRALAPERVRMTLVSASTSFAYKPAATIEAFDEAPPLTYDLRAIAADVGAAFRFDRFEAVAVWLPQCGSRPSPTSATTRSSSRSAPARPSAYRAR